MVILTDDDGTLRDSSKAPVSPLQRKLTRLLQDLQAKDDEIPDTEKLFGSLRSEASALLGEDGNLPSVEQTLGSVKILRQIGEGGMGLVYEAVQTSLQREVAVKRPIAGIDAEQAEHDILQEAYLLGRLEHSAIPPVHLIGEDQEGRPLLVMKRIRGEPWSEMLATLPREKDGTLTQEELTRQLRYFHAIANATAFANSQGIVHRDIKPSNVMISNYGEIYLIDWGIAVELDNAGEFYPRVYAGTPSISAPEMLSTRNPITIQTDVYLLGSLLHELLTGTPRHTGDSMSQVLECIQQSHQQEYQEGIPRILASVCNRATSVDPRDRFSTATDMLEAVDTFVTHMGAIEKGEQAQQMLHELRAMVRRDTIDPSVIEEHGIRCRYALDRALTAWPDNLEAREQTIECLALLLHHSISIQNIPIARSLLEELMQHPEAYEEVAQAEGQLADLLRQYDTQPSELSTQIQYTLMERLVDLQRSIEEKGKRSDGRSKERGNGT